MTRQRWLAASILLLVVCAALGAGVLLDGHGSSQRVDRAWTDLDSVQVGADQRIAGTAASTAQARDRLHTYRSSARPRGRAAGSQATAIVQNVTYRLLPDRPEQVEAVIRYDVPAGVTELEFTVQHGEFEVASTDGFSRTGGDTFEWSGAGGGGTVTLRHGVDQPLRETDGDGPRVAGTGDWAVVVRPSIWTEWRYQGSNPGIGYRLSVDGEGYAGEHLAFLGTHQRREATVDGETISLVLPAAAQPASDPGTILHSLSNASDRFRVGSRNEEIVVIAAPTDGVDWGTNGYSIGPDAWVAASSPVDRNTNVWIHEFVHARHHRFPGSLATETRWLVEGSAEYYGSLFNVYQGHTRYDGFRTAMEEGTDDHLDGVVLADPATWTGGAEYERGPLVVGAIDRRLREATDGEATFRDVVRAWNEDEDTFTSAEFLATVEELGGPEVGAYAHNLTETQRAPSLWDFDAHAAAFDVSIPYLHATVRTDPFLRIDGPNREGPVTGPVAPGETIVATAEVTNNGTAAGTYRTSLREGTNRFAADPIVNETVRVEPGETETVALRYRPERAGRHDLWSGETRASMRVSEPAPANATSLRIEPANPEPGENVTVTATLRNDAAFARGDLTVVGNATAANRTALLGAGESTNLSVGVGPVDAGTLTVRAGNRTRNVSVAEPSESALPGLGLPAALAALGVAVASLARRGRRRALE